MWPFAMFVVKFFLLNEQRSTAISQDGAVLSYSSVIIRTALKNAYRTCFKMRQFSILFNTKTLYCNKVAFMPYLHWVESIFLSIQLYSLKSKIIFFLVMAVLLFDSYFFKNCFISNSTLKYSTFFTQI